MDVQSSAVCLCTRSRGMSAEEAETGYLPDLNYRHKR